METAYSDKISSAVLLRLLLLAAVNSGAAAYSPSLQWQEGAHASFYGGSYASGTLGGSCGYGDLYSTGYKTAATALSGALFGGGSACGACFEIMCVGSSACTDNTVVVTATNLCPTDSLGGWCNFPKLHFDMAEPSFSIISHPAAGVVSVKYRRAACQRSGGIEFTITGNPAFTLVVITNVAGAGDVQEAHVKGDHTGWITMLRNWGQVWLCRANLVGQGLSFMVITSDGATSVSYNVAGSNWAFGQTFAGSQYYP